MAPVLTCQEKAEIKALGTRREEGKRILVTFSELFQKLVIIITEALDTQQTQQSVCLQALRAHSTSESTPSLSSYALPLRPRSPFKAAPKVPKYIGTA